MRKGLLVLGLLGIVFVVMAGCAPAVAGPEQGPGENTNGNDGPTGGGDVPEPEPPVEPAFSACAPSGSWPGFIEISLGQENLAELGIILTAYDSAGDILASQHLDLSGCAALAKAGELDQLRVWIDGPAATDDQVPSDGLTAAGECHRPGLPGMAGFRGLAAGSYVLVELWSGPLRKAVFGLAADSAGAAAAALVPDLAVLRLDALAPDGFFLRGDSGWAAYAPGTLELGELAITPAPPPANAWLEADGLVHAGDALALRVPATGQGLDTAPSLELWALDGDRWRALPAQGESFSWIVDRAAAGKRVEISARARGEGPRLLGCGRAMASDAIERERRFGLEIGAARPRLLIRSCAPDSLEFEPGQELGLAIVLESLDGGAPGVLALGLERSLPLAPLDWQSAGPQTNPQDIRASFRVPGAAVPGPDRLRFLASHAGSPGFETWTELPVMIRQARQAFANGDCEFDPVLSAGLKPSGSGFGPGGFGGSRGLHVAGSLAANDFVLRVGAPLRSPAAGVSALSFRMKGTLPGKSLSCQFGSVGSGAAGDIFPLGTVGAAGRSVGAASNHSYSGNIDTQGQWTTVRLELVRDSGSANDTNLDQGFAIKMGGGAAADLWFDDFCWE